MRWLWRLFNLAPFCLLAWFVSRFAVNVPVIDEWALAYWFHAVRLRQETFDGLFALNFEHRIVFPRLMWTPLAFATHWNLRIEMMLHVVLVLIVFIVLNKLAAWQAQRSGTLLFELASFSTSLLLFSLVQYDTWLWGINGAFVLVQLSVALAIGVCYVEKLHPWFRLSLAALFCFVASFSAAQGLASWPALLPCIAHLKIGEPRARKFYVWFLLFTASIAIYSYHFTFFIPGEENSPLDFLQRPFRSVAFFLALLGSPFAQGNASNFAPLACLAGGAILLGLIYCAVTLRKSGNTEMVAPWLSMAIFGLLFAAMATAGRSTFFVFAMRTRYITVTIFVAIALVQLGREVYLRKASHVYLLFLGALWALLLTGSVRAVAEAEQLKEDRAHAKLFLEVLRYVNPAIDDSPRAPTSPLYIGSSFRGSAELLNELGFLHLASDLSFIEQPCADCGAFESADGLGSLLHLRQGKDEITVSGWASLPGNRGLPKLVLISYGDQKTFITGAVVGLVERPDIAAFRQDSRYLHSGWRVAFPAQFLPLGKGTLKAWVYDSAEKRFIRMADSGGEKRFNVETQ